MFHSVVDKELKIEEQELGCKLVKETYLRKKIDAKELSDRLKTKACPAELIELGKDKPRNQPATVLKMSQW